MRINTESDMTKRMPITHLLTHQEQAGIGCDDVIEFEDLVTDGRALIRPAQVVEGRLMASMKRLPMLVSQFDRTMKPRFG